MASSASLTELCSILFSDARTPLIWINKNWKTSSRWPPTLSLSLSRRILSRSILENQQDLEDLLAVASEESFDQARRIYNEGAHSNTHAEIFLVRPFPINVEKGTPVLGVAVDGSQVAGTAAEDNAAAATSMIVRYQTFDTQQNYSGCQVGESTQPVTEGCLARSGDIAIDSRNPVSVGYTYSLLENNFAKRSLKNIFTTAQTRANNNNNNPTYDKFYEYYEESNYADQIVQAAFDGTSYTVQSHNFDFGFDRDDRRDLLVARAIVCLNVWMAVIQQLEDALQDCTEGGCSTGTGDDACQSSIESWDVAAAFYTGSLEGQDGTGSGVLLYDLADDICGEFSTCDGEGTDTDKGTSWVNRAVIDELTMGQFELAQGQCEAARAHKNAIEQWMLVPLVQGFLRSTWNMDDDKVEYSGANNAAAKAFALLILPVVHACDEGAANIIACSMAPRPALSNIFQEVNSALESTYICLGLSPAMIGSLTPTASPSMNPSVSPSDSSSEIPSDSPSHSSMSPSVSPSDSSNESPSDSPSDSPSESPSGTSSKSSKMNSSSKSSKNRYI